MTATLSISSGVFVFKNPSKKKKRLTTSSFWRVGDDLELRQLTYENYKACKSIINEILQELESNIHNKVFADLVNFIKNARNGRTEKSSVYTHKFVDIPTACLITGINMPDHEVTFNNLTRMLRENVTPYIARLRGKDCKTVRTILVNMIIQMIGNENVSDDENDEIDDLSLSPSKKLRIKRSQCSMSFLKAWYKEQETCRIRSPSKKKYKDKKVLSDFCNNEQTKPLVLILEDVESFPQNLLQDIILICSQYQDSLPCVFVFGVATTPAVIHSALNQEASACISMETFQSHPSSYYLNEIITKVLMTDNVPLHLGGRVFKLLLDTFLYHDLSVRNFIKALQYCMLEHFSSSDASILSCQNTLLTKRLDLLNTQQMDLIRKQPSFQSFLSSCSPEKQSLYNESLSALKGIISLLLKDLQDWYRRLCNIVKILFILCGSLPTFPLGRQLREVLAVCLNGKLIESEEFQKAWKLLSFMSREELLPLLKEVIVKLEECSNDIGLQKLSKQLNDLVDIINNLGEANTVVGAHNENAVLDLNVSNRFQLKEKLQKYAKQKSQHLNAYESVRSEALNTLLTVFQNEVVPVSSKTLHEVMFFDSVSSVKRPLAGAIRSAISTALSNPSSYLQCQCCRMGEDPTAIVPTLPDISIAYKLHLECGKYINLYDWMQAFIAVVEGDVDVKKKMDSKLQARFAQAVTELQFLGFIKPTKRKTDHVARLTWDNY